ncbi:MAG: hypothetical protein ACRDCW_04725 [Sarcina sp.]
MSKINKTITTSLSILSFVLLCIMALFWFLLTYWEFPPYSNSTSTFMKNGVSGLNWLFVHALYFIAFFPLLLAIIIIFIEFIFLKRKNIILKVCFSLILLFGISISIIPFLTSESNIYISKFSTSNWESVPKLRYESVDNLEKTYHLIGMSSNELFNLLGSEDYQTENYNSTSYYWDLKDSLSINNEYLEITVSNGKIISYKTVSNSIQNEN